MNKFDARFWLLATVVLTACEWMPYVLDRFIRLGVVRTLGNPRPYDRGQQSAWALRAQAAHANAVENLAVFAPLALLAIQSGKAATGACAAYFAARLAHYILYLAGVPGARTLFFLAGFAAQLALALVVAS